MNIDLDIEENIDKKTSQNNPCWEILCVLFNCSGKCFVAICFIAGILALLRLIFFT